MANHGGEHVWDITHAQAKDALYVRTIPSIKMLTVRDELSKSHIVVQHRISRIRFRHPPHKIIGIVPLPASVLARAMESI